MVHLARQGVLAGAGAVPAAARRHRPQLPRSHRLPRPARSSGSGCAARRAACRTASTTAGSTSAPTAPATRCRPCRCWTPSPTHRFDAVFGGGRRDEEQGAGQGADLSLRDAFGQWDPRSQRPELWNLYNGRHTARRARARVPASATGPNSTSGATSSAKASSCPRSTTPTSARCSAATACGWPRAVGGPRDDERMRARTGALPHCRRHALHRRGRVATPPPSPR